MTFTDAPRPLIFTCLLMILTCYIQTKILRIVVNEELIKVGDWLDANKLSLNTSKSNFAIFHPYQHKPDNKIQLKIYNNDLKNSIPLEQKTFEKYLGILIDVCIYVCVCVWWNHDELCDFFLEAPVVCVVSLWTDPSFRRIMQRILFTFSPVILWKKIGQPATNCNRRFFNGFRLCNVSLITYQKSRKIPLREVTKKRNLLWSSETRFLSAWERGWPKLFL